MSTLRVDENKITSKNAFDENYFGTGGNYESSNDRKTFVMGIFQDLWHVL